MNVQEGDPTRLPPHYSAFFFYQKENSHAKWAQLADNFVEETG